MQELNSHCHTSSKSKEDQMDLPHCSSVLGSAGSLMTSEAPPPTLHKLKTACGLQLGKVFSSISATLTSIPGDLWFDDRIQRDVNPYFIHLIWRLFWLLLPFATVLEYKANPLKSKGPQVQRPCEFKQVMPLYAPWGLWNKRCPNVCAFTNRFSL